MKTIQIDVEVFDGAAWNPADRDGRPEVIKLDMDDLMAILNLRGYKRGSYSVSLRQVSILEMYDKK